MKEESLQIAYNRIEELELKLESANSKIINLEENTKQLESRHRALWSKNDVESDYAKMYGDKSNKFVTEEHKDNTLDNLYKALYRLANATHAANEFIKTNNDAIQAIQAASFAINSRAIELEKSIGLNGPASGQIPTGNTGNL